MKSALVALCVALSFLGANASRASSDAILKEISDASRTRSEIVDHNTALVEQVQNLKAELAEVKRKEIIDHNTALLEQVQNLKAELAEAKRGGEMMEEKKGELSACGGGKADDGNSCECGYDVGTCKNGKCRC